eukprot:CAMPEP_0116133104 /NCGR_PEP_ID=MMETSP0329-20121206/9923_1 /TAXON_ID=697910 /ORGANISM="Pseudo-nitzschia arenysensis, Strain B593" /LENGTH=625 /DNA_ID=CAMNT_0003627703 /DNA_START=229 /DNA_END=2106 /DNA_ORIENTATION=+
MEDCNRIPARRDFPASSQLSAPIPTGGSFSISDGGQYTRQNAESNEYTGPNDNAMNYEETLAMNPVSGSSTVRTVFDNSTLEIDEETHLDRILDDFDTAINQIESQIGNSGNSEFEAYKFAREQDAAYVTNPDFTIGFLRAEDYNVRKAAWRMFRYLKIKREIFGDDKVTRDILLDDLGEKGKEILDRGPMQVLTKPDNNGRAVVFCTYHVDKIRMRRKDFESVNKASFYFWTYAIEEADENFKKKGIVAIAWKVNNHPVPNIAIATKCNQIWRSAPMKVSDSHVCHSPISTRNFGAFELFAKMASLWTNNQGYGLESHCGTAMEVEYELKTKHNIPTEFFPFDPWSIDSIHTRYHKAWMNQRNFIDQKKAELSTSLRRSSLDQPERIGFWNESSMISDDESMINDEDDILFVGSPNTTEDINLEQPMNFSIASVDSFFEGDSISVDRSIDYSNGSNAIMIIDGDRVISDFKETQLTNDRDDIKLGRGKGLQQHPGNKWLKNFISIEYENYNTLDRNKQTKFATAIVAKIKSTGRRFLKKSGNDWIEIKDTKARENVASRFRNERKRRLDESETGACASCNTDATYAVSSEAETEYAAGEDGDDSASSCVVTDPLSLYEDEQVHY